MDRHRATLDSLVCHTHYELCAYWLRTNNRQMIFQALNAGLLERARSKTGKPKRTCNYHECELAFTLLDLYSLTPNDVHFKMIDGVRRRMSDTKKKHAEELERVEVLRAELVSQSCRVCRSGVIF